MQSVAAQFDALVEELVEETRSLRSSYDRCTAEVQEMRAEMKADKNQQLLDSAQLGAKSDQHATQCEQILVMNNLRNEIMQLANGTAAAIEGEVRKCTVPLEDSLMKMVKAIQAEEVARRDSVDELRLCVFEQLAGATALQPQESELSRKLATEIEGQRAESLEFKGCLHEFRAQLRSLSRERDLELISRVESLETSVAQMHGLAPEVMRETQELLMLVTSIVQVSHDLQEQMQKDASSGKLHARLVQLEQQVFTSGDVLSRQSQPLMEQQARPETTSNDLCSNLDSLIQRAQKMLSRSPSETVRFAAQVEAAHTEAPGNGSCSPRAATYQSNSLGSQTQLRHVMSSPRLMQANGVTQGASGTSAQAMGARRNDSQRLAPHPTSQYRSLHAPVGTHRVGQIGGGQFKSIISPAVQTGAATPPISVTRISPTPPVPAKRVSSTPPFPAARINVPVSGR